MEAAGGDDAIEDATHLLRAPPAGGVNELHDVGQEDDDMQGQVGSALRPHSSSVRIKLENEYVFFWPIYSS